MRRIQVKIPRDKMKAHSDAELVTKVRALSPGKALALLAYGESVAAFRYRTIADRVVNPALKQALEDMADEEQGHHEMVQSLLARHFPGSDFVLSSDDKNLVSVGPRQLNFKGSESFAETLKIIQASEIQTGKFYQSLKECPPDPSLAPLFAEMADECFEHAERLTMLPPWDDPSEGESPKWSTS